MCIIIIPYLGGGFGGGGCGTIPDDGAPLHAHVLAARDPSAQNAVVPAREKSCVALHEHDDDPGGAPLGGGVGAVPYSLIVTSNEVDPSVHFKDDEHPLHGVALHS